jgi:hypothetical protein
MRMLPYASIQFHKTQAPLPTSHMSDPKWYPLESKNHFLLSRSQSSLRRSSLLMFIAWNCAGLSIESDSLLSFIRCFYAVWWLRIAYGGHAYGALERAAEHLLLELLQTEQQCNDWWESQVMPNLSCFAWVNPTADLFLHLSHYLSLAVYPSGLTTLGPSSL